MITVTHHQGGPQVHIFGARVHHGHIGLWLIAAGFVLIIHDWADRPWGFA